MLTEEDEEGVEVLNVPPDSRIRWVHFLLGCAVLLPWNGAQSNLLCWYMSELVDTRASHGGTDRDT